MTDRFGSFDRPSGIPNGSHFEPLLWILFSPLCVVHEWTALAYVAAGVGRLIALGPEGWVLLYLSGQPLVYAGFLKAEIDQPILAVTSVLTNLVCVGYWMARRKTPAEMIALTAFLIVYTLATWQMFATGNELTETLRQRIQLFLSQGAAGVLVFATALTHRFRIDRLAAGAGIVSAGVLGGMLVAGARLFTRMYEAPIIDWGRTGAIAMVVFLIGAAFSGHWRRTCYVGMAGLAGLLSISQLLRQSAYAAVLCLAAMAVLFPNVHRFQLKKLLCGLAAAGLLAAVLQGDVLADKVGRLIGGTTTSKEVSDAARSEAKQVAADLIREAPVFGTGFGGFSDEWGYDYYPHNMFLEILCEFGLFGLAVACLPIVAGVLVLKDLPPGDPRGDIALAAVATFWFLVSQASYSLPHSCACFPAALAGIAIWRRVRARPQFAATQYGLPHRGFPRNGSPQRAAPHAPRSRAA